MNHSPNTRTGQPNAMALPNGAPNARTEQPNTMAFPNGVPDAPPNGRHRRPRQWPAWVSRLYLLSLGMAVSIGVIAAARIPHP